MFWKLETIIKIYIYDGKRNGASWGRGQHMKKKPKKDSFSYNTDWKAADLVPSTDILGTAMIMTAVARVSGMTAKTTVQMVMKVDDILDDVK